MPYAALEKDVERLEGAQRSAVALSARCAIESTGTAPRRRVDNHFNTEREN